jgi:hypothetical protein
MTPESILLLFWLKSVKTKEMMRAITQILKKKISSSVVVKFDEREKSSILLNIC